MNDNDMYTTQEIQGQNQPAPGKESQMNPEPIYDMVVQLLMVKLPETAVMLLMALPLILIK